jgi:hypothetical protein
MTKKGELMVPISVGELVDKMTILQIKFEMISDLQKKENIAKELEVNKQVFERAVLPSDEMNRLVEEMKKVNLEIWHISDRIHECERKNVVSEEDIHFYRLVHNKNDDRFRIKKQINALSDSALVEEKSYVGL